MPKYELKINGSTYEVEAQSEQQLPEIADQIAKENPQQSLMDSAKAIPGQIAGGISSAVQGQHDPQTSHVREVNPAIMNRKEYSPLEPMGFAAPAKMMTSNDQEYGQVMLKRLQDMGYRAELFNDANGYPMISYVTPDGAKSETRYVNKPGLGFEDIDRALAQAATYAPGAGMAAKATAGLGVGRALTAQGAAAGATSLGTDAVASSQGSQVTPEEAVSDAATAAAFGAGGEVAGRMIRPLIDMFRARRMIGPNGELTEQAAQIAKQNGVNPEDIAQEYVKQYADDAIRSGDPASAGRKVMYDQNSIPATRGSITRNPEDLRMEDEMLKGRFGNEAQQTIQPYMDDTVNFQRMTTDKIENMTGQQPTLADEAGQALQDRVRSDFTSDQQKVSRAWQGVDRDALRVQRRQPSAGRYISDELASEIDGLGSDKLSSRQAYNMIEKFKAGQLKTDPITKGAEPKPVSLLDIRDRLAQYADEASGNAQEYRRVAKLRDAFDLYVKDLARRGEYGVASKDIQQYVQAYDMSRQLKNKYRSRGKLDMGGKFIEKVLDKDVTPQLLVDELFGATFKPRQNSLASVKRTLEVLGPDSTEAELLRASLITKATQNKAGNMLIPSKQIENIESILANKAAREMLGSKMVFQLGKFKRDLQKLKRPDVPAGPSSTLQANLRTRRDSVLQYLLKAKGSGERFSGNPAGATFWHVVARSLPKGMSVADIAGKQAVKKQIKNVLPTRPYSGSGATAGQLFNREE
jgi:hypothetical protein